MTHKNECIRVDIHQYGIDENGYYPDVRVAYFVIDAPQRFVDVCHIDTLLDHKRSFTIKELCHTVHMPLPQLYDFIQRANIFERIHITGPSTINDIMHENGSSVIAMRSVFQVSTRIEHPDAIRTDEVHYIAGNLHIRIPTDKPCRIPLLNNIEAPLERYMSQTECESRYASVLYDDYHNVQLYLLAHQEKDNIIEHEEMELL